MHDKACPNISIGALYYEGIYRPRSPRQASRLISPAVFAATAQQRMDEIVYATMEALAWLLSHEDAELSPGGRRKRDEWIARAKELMEEMVTGGTDEEAMAMVDERAERLRAERNAGGFQRGGTGGGAEK